MRIERVDIADTDGVAELRATLSDEKLDLLFVIACGVSGSVPKPLHEVTADEAARVFLINAYYPIAAAEAFADLLGSAGTVAFMLLGLGSIALNDYGQVGNLSVEQGGAQHGRAQFLPPAHRSRGPVDCARLGAHRHGRTGGDI